MSMEVDPVAGPSSSKTGDGGGGSAAGNNPVVLAKGAAAAAAASSSSSGLSVALHPLVIMNISEHWTRTRAQEGRPTQVYGALIGRQEGRRIEIMNSFELDHAEIDGRVVIDRDYYALKEGQFKQVFSEMDFLGWYSTGEAPTESDILVHRQICDINESPLFLQLNPASRAPVASGGDLPVSMYESIIDLITASEAAAASASGSSKEASGDDKSSSSSSGVPQSKPRPGGEARMLFLPLSYTLATEEAERIGLDHVARISGATGDEAQSKVAEHVLVQHSAIKMLASR